MKGKQPLHGIFALGFGWTQFGQNVGQDLGVRQLNHEIWNQPGSVWLANFAVPIGSILLLYRQHVLSLVPAALGVVFALRAFQVFGASSLFSGYYFWLASLVAFLVMTIAAVVESSGCSTDEAKLLIPDRNS